MTYAETKAAHDAIPVEELGKIIRVAASVRDMVEQRSSKIAALTAERDGMAERLESQLAKSGKGDAS